MKFFVQSFFLQVCDEPHPVLIKEMITHCIGSCYDDAYKVKVKVSTFAYTPEVSCCHYNVFRLFHLFIFKDQVIGYSAA